MEAEKAIEWMEKAIQETERDFDLCSPALQKELTEQKEVFETAIAALRSLAKGKDKDVSALTEQLRRMSVETGSLVCLGCGHEHNCGIHGCALLRQAVETIEKQAAVIDRFLEVRKIIPLTLEQLRNMDRFSPPIYDICLNEWCCVRKDACAGDIGVSYIGGGTRPLEENRFYPYPLPHIDREVWEPCKMCDKTAYLMGAHYCPHCGRPLTEEAWAELEKHIGGAV